MGKKVTIIGAGSVGSTIAYTMAVNGIATEVVMIDINETKALGEALGEQYVHIRFRRLRGRDILRFIAHFCDDSAYLKVECKIKQTKLM